MKTQDQSLYHGINKAINAIQRDAEKIFSKYDLTKGQFSIMEVLHKNGESSIGHVQETILMTGGNIPVIVNNLIKKGLLIRKQDESDRRRSEEHTSELQSRQYLVCRLLLEKKNI